MSYLKRFFLTAALCCSTLVHADYPERAVTLVLPSPPGGSADATARPLAKALGDMLKQPFVVMNKAGAGGAIAYNAVATAKPDGHTLLLGISTISVLPEAERMDKRKTSYEIDQFVPVALLTAEPLVLLVRSDSPWKHVRDFVRDAKAEPGKYKYSSSGKFGPIHFPMEMLAKATEIKLLHIPYSGGAPAATALLAGHVDVTAAGPAAATAMASDGRVRILAHWGNKRLAQLPQVPSLRELGFNAEYYLWAGLFAPAGTPEEVLTKLRAAVKTTMESPSYQTEMAAVHIPLTYLDAPEFATYWRRDAQALITLAKEIGRVD